MRILFIRHGEPDYANDNLTEKGRKEARQLALCAHDINMGECFVSPLGRAQKTAAYSLRALNREAETLDWLREFPARVDLNRYPQFRSVYPNTRKQDGLYIPRVVWDMLPSYWTVHRELLGADSWRESEVCLCSGAVQIYDQVTEAFDRLLGERGYVRDGQCYKVEKENTGTVTFFCHFGITCVLLSHLWNISPFLLWHTLALAPTSVTEVVTEEREKGIAVFRGLKMGDVSHLYAGREPVSFAARFCEVYSSADRH